MKVYIGADHRGVELKSQIIGVLKEDGHDVVDLGTNDSAQSCDYPQIAYKVASRVAKEPNSRGILACMSGIGQAIAANKIKGAYAALCCNAKMAELSRQHNNSNILVIGAGFVQQSEIPQMIKGWFKAEFEGGRHLRRFEQIQSLERGEAI